MLRIFFHDRQALPQLVNMGSEGEHLVQQVGFDLPDELAGARVLLHLQLGAYADVVTLGEERIFTPTRSHTAHPGRHTAWLEALPDEERVWRSEVFYLHIHALPEDGEMLEQLYPTAVEQAMAAAAMLSGLKAQTETLAAGQAAAVRVQTAEDGSSSLIFGIPKGDQGEKPVAGVDYFTQADRAAMVQQVLNDLQAAEGEAY